MTIPSLRRKAPKGPRGEDRWRAIPAWPPPLDQSSPGCHRRSPNWISRVKMHLRLPSSSRMGAASAARGCTAGNRAARVNRLQFARLRRVRASQMGAAVAVARLNGAPRAAVAVRIGSSCPTRLRQAVGVGPRTRTELRSCKCSAAAACMLSLKIRRTG